MSVASLLKKSPVTGKYSFRKRVPKDLLEAWGKREVKKSLKTDKHPKALRRAAELNMEFDEKAAQLRKQLSADSITNRAIMEAAKDILMKEGVHPQQMPKTKEDALKFFKKQDEWRQFYLEIMPDVTEHNSYDASGSIETYREIDKSNPYNQAYKVINGGEGLSLVPTLKEATETYLKINAEEK